MQFADKLANLLLRKLVRVAAQGGRPIETAEGPARTRDRGLQVAPALQPMQHWIQSAGTERVAVAREFLNHPLPVETFFGRVMQDVQPNESFQQFLMLHPGHRRPMLYVLGYQGRRVEQSEAPESKVAYFFIGAACEGERPGRLSGMERGARS